MWSEPEQKSKSMSISSLPTHWTRWACPFHEQGPQALCLKPVTYSQDSTKQTSVQKLEGESRLWKPRQNHLIKQGAAMSQLSLSVVRGKKHNHWSKKKKKNLCSNDSEAGEIWKVSKVSTALHHSKEEIKKKNVYKPLWTAQFTIWRWRGGSPMENYTRLSPSPLPFS